MPSKSRLAQTQGGFQYRKPVGSAGEIAAGPLLFLEGETREQPECSIDFNTLTI